VALYKNAEIRKGGNTIRANVVVDTYVPLTTASVEWGGTLHPPNNTGLALGESYTLVLPGFTPAKILITSEASPHDGIVSFKGVGAMPVGASSNEVHGAK